MIIWLFVLRDEVILTTFTDCNRYFYTNLN